jgi:hypothetical protein
MRSETTEIERLIDAGPRCISRPRKFLQRSAIELKLR